MSKYRAGAIGSTGKGNWGHGLDVAFVGVSDVDFVSIADDDPEGLKAATERTGAKASFIDYHEMLNKENLDFVAVCPRWVGSHRDMITAAAEAGVKGIFCEKPFAPTLVDADAMIETCERTKTRVVVAHQRRANPYERYAKKLIRDGAIGDLLTIKAHGKSDLRSGSQDLVVLGTHILDSIRFIVDSTVLWATGHVTQNGHDVTLNDVKSGTEEIGLIAGNGVSAYYAFENGVSAYFDSLPRDMSGNNTDSAFGYEIYGTKAILSMRTLPEGNMFIHEYNQWLPGSKNEEWKPIILDDWGIISSEYISLSNEIIVRELIDAVKNNRELVDVSTDTDGRAALEMIMAVHESQRIGGRVSFPMINRENPYEVWRRETA